MLEELREYIVALEYGVSQISTSEMYDRQDEMYDKRERIEELRALLSRLEELT